MANLELGKGLYLVSSGEFTANGATGVVVTEKEYVKGTSICLFSLKTVAGTIGAPQVADSTVGTNVTFKSLAGDTSVYNYFVFNPLPLPL